MAVQNTDTITGLVLNGVDIPLITGFAGGAVITRDTQRVILTVGLGAKLIVGDVDGITVLVVVCRQTIGGGVLISQLVPHIGAAGDSEELGLIVVGHGIHDLNAGSVLVVLQSNVLVLLQVHIDEANLVIGVQLYIHIGFTGVGVLVSLIDLLDGGIAVLVADTIVVIVAALLLGLIHAAIPAQPGQSVALGQNHLVETIAELNIIRRSRRNDDGVKEQDQNDECCSHGGLVFLEAIERILQRANRLCLQLLISQTVALIGKLELFFGNIIVCHIISLPS